MQQDKKKYLKSYCLQEKKIQSLRKLIIKEPKRRKVYEDGITKAEALRTEIENKIKAIDDPLLSEVLTQRYIFGHTLEELSCILNYSKRHILRLQIKALEKINI